MITHLDLDSHYTLSKDLVVEMPAPFKPIGDGPGITPAIAPGRTIRVRFTLETTR